MKLTLVGWLKVDILVSVLVSWVLRGDEIKGFESSGGDEEKKSRLMSMMDLSAHDWAVFTQVNLCLKNVHNHF